MVDGDGNAYVTGSTLSVDFPEAGQPQPGYAGPFDPSNLGDAFVFKLAADGGSLVFSTYLGGSGDESPSLVDFGTRQNTMGIDVDSVGNIYVLSTSDSTDFPVVNGFQNSRAGLQDLVLAKLAPDGSGILYSTYLGGSGADYSGDVAVTDTGRAWVVGGTLSSNFPVRGALDDSRDSPADAIVAAIDTSGAGNGSLVSSTYLGGNDTDQAFAVGLDGAGRVYLTGFTGSTDFPVADSFQGANASAAEPSPRDAFLTVLSADGRTLVYSTYFGGSARDVAYDLTVDPAGKVVIAGPTSSDDLPLRLAYQGRRIDGSDLFVSRFDPTRSGVSSLESATYLGGAGNGALEVVADREVKATSRTYNQIAGDAPCSPGGTLGQGFGSFPARDALLAGEEAWLPQLVENSAYRTNIALTNTGLATAEVRVRLYDGGGSQLTSTVVTLDPGQWTQLNRPFSQLAGESDLMAGYARVKVEAGGGVLVVGSVVDNITNDPTTIQWLQ